MGLCVCVCLCTMLCTVLVCVCYSHFYWRCVLAVCPRFNKHLLCLVSLLLYCSLSLFASSITLHYAHLRAPHSLLVDFGIYHYFI